MNTEQEVRDVIRTNDVVVVDFMAQWCSPCRVLAPIVEEIKKEYEGKAVVLTVDVEENESLATEFNIRNIPTILYFVNGELKNKSHGLISKDVLSAMICSAIEMSK